MIAEMVVRRRMRTFLDAFERKDVDGLSALWADDVVVEFPAGVPMAGTWRGKEEVRGLFEAIFAHNKRLRFTLRHVTVSGAWSPTGRSTVMIEWDAEEERPDGHTLTMRVVSVAESRWWRGVRSRDYFSDVPAVAAYYQDIALPARPSSNVATGIG